METLILLPDQDALAPGDRVRAIDGRPNWPHGTIEEVQSEECVCVRWDNAIVEMQSVYALTRIQPGMPESATS